MDIEGVVCFGDVFKLRLESVDGVIESVYGSRAYGEMEGFEA